MAAPMMASVVFHGCHASRGEERHRGEERRGVAEGAGGRGAENLKT